MTATIELSGAESSVENVQTYADSEFDYALEMGYRQHASGVIADGPLLTTGYYNHISDSTFGGESDLTSVGDLVSNCRFYDLNLNSNLTRVVGVYAGSGDLKIYGDDCVVLGYSTQTVVIDVGAARTRYGANQESTSLTDNSTTTIYLDNDKISATDIEDVVDSTVVKDIVFVKSGTLVDAYTGTKRVYTKTARTITGCFASVDGVPVTNPAVFDVFKDGSTIFTTTGNRPDVAAAAYVGDLETPDVTAWAAGSYLTVNVVTASSATDLTLTVQYTEA